MILSSILSMIVLNFSEFIGYPFLTRQRGDLLREELDDSGSRKYVRATASVKVLRTVPYGGGLALRQLRQSLKAQPEIWGALKHPYVDDLLPLSHDIPFSAAIVLPYPPDVTPLVHAKFKPTMNSLYLGLAKGLRIHPYRRLAGVTTPQLAASTVLQRFSIGQQYDSYLCKMGLGPTTISCMSASPNVFGIASRYFLAIKAIPYPSLLSPIDGAAISHAERVSIIYNFRQLRVGNSLLWSTSPSFGPSGSHPHFTDLFTSPVTRIPSLILQSRLALTGTCLPQSTPPSIPAPFVSSNPVYSTGLLANANSLDVRDGVFNDIHGDQANIGHVTVGDIHIYFTTPNRESKCIRLAVLAALTIVVLLTVD